MLSLTKLQTRNAPAHTGAFPFEHLSDQSQALCSTGLAQQVHHALLTLICLCQHRGGGLR